VQQKSPRRAIEGGPSTRGLGEDGKPVRAAPSAARPRGPGEPPPPATAQKKKNLALSDEEVARRLEKELGL
jgi:hypothetical protein